MVWWCVMERASLGPPSCATPRQPTIYTTYAFKESTYFPVIVWGLKAWQNNSWNENPVSSNGFKFVFSTIYKFQWKWKCWICPNWNYFHQMNLNMKVEVFCVQCASQIWQFLAHKQKLCSIRVGWKFASKIKLKISCFCEYVRVKKLHK